jgi:hypothetical protein
MSLALLLCGLFFAAADSPGLQVSFAKTDFTKSKQEVSNEKISDGGSICIRYICVGG